MKSTLPEMRFWNSTKTNPVTVFSIAFSFGIKSSVRFHILCLRWY